jgi:hypothetical protein
MNSVAEPESTVPARLYRYRAFKDDFDSLRRILIKNEWYCGSRLDFDDQQDCLIPGIIIEADHLRELAAKMPGGLTNERETEIERLLRDPEAARAAVQKYVDNVGMLCLSELGNNDELWGDYANHGLGACLELDTLKVANSQKYLYRGPFEINYSDEPKLLWDPRLPDSLQLVQTEDHLLRKSAKWAYQKEWRFIMYDGDKKTVRDHSIPPDAVTGLILGNYILDSLG